MPAGEDMGLMLDVNCPWSVREALDMADKLRPVNLRWLEEPVWPPENYAGLADVRANGGIPVAAGENAATLMQYQQLLETGAVDFLQPSPIKMGGISELRKVFALAAAQNVTVMPHSFYDGPGFLAAVHVNAAVGQGSLVEWRYFDLEAKLYGVGRRTRTAPSPSRRDRGWAWIPIPMSSNAIARTKGLLLSG